MNAESEIASLQAKVAALESKLTEAQNQLTSKIGTAESKATAAMTQAQQATSWQQRLRGTQGITVRGNVIEGPPTNQGSGAGTGSGALGPITDVVMVVDAVLYEDCVLNGTLGTVVP